MPVNPFALLSTGDSDDEGGDSPAPVKAAPKAAPAKSKSSKGPRKPAAPEKKASVHGTDQEYHAESRGGRGGKGGRGSKAGRGRGGRGDNRTNDRQSRGKDTKTVAKSGHGTGNWGGAKDDINAAASGAADAKAESKAADGEAVEEAEEVEEVQVSADDFFAAEATKKSKFAVKARKVTDADTGDFKVGGAVREKVEEKEINYGGKAAKQKKKSKRSGRKAEQILVDLKFNNESSQMEAKPGEPGYGAGDGGKGGKGGKGKGKRRPPNIDNPFWEKKVEEEERKAVGSKVFTGTIQRYIYKVGFGFITPDEPATLPKNVKTALAKQTQDARDAGKEITDDDLLYFRKPDVNHTEGFKLAEGTPCTFQVYVDNKGAGAYEVSMVE